mgnify:CR=1 FL=1
MVQWEGYDEKSWEPERNFVSFTLSDYWKDKVDKFGKVKDGEKEKESQGQKREEDVEEVVNDEREYQILSIEDHERIDGVLFEKVEWKDEKYRGEGTRK